MTNTEVEEMRLALERTAKQDTITLLRDQIEGHESAINTLFELIGTSLSETEAYGHQCCIGLLQVINNSHRESILALEGLF